MMITEEEKTLEALQSSSDQGEGVFQLDDPPLFKLKRGKITKELFALVLPAIPASSSLILAYFPNALNLYFISKNNDLLDICVIGSFLIGTNILGGTFLMALSNELGHCISDLNDQPNATFRAPYNKYTTGLYFHRSLVLGVMFMSLWFPLLGHSGVLAEYFLDLPLGFSSKLQTYSLCLLPSLFFSFCFDLTRSLLVGCEELSLPCSFLVLTIFLHYLFCLLFELEGRFEVAAAGFCKNITDFLNTFLLMLYAWNLRALHKVWIPWTSNSFKNLLSHIDIGSLFQNLIELLTYETLSLAVLLSGNIRELTGYFIVACIQTMNLAIDRGLAQTVRILIWKAVKDGAVNKAKNRTWIGLGLIVLLATIEVLKALHNTRLAVNLQFIGFFVGGTMLMGYFGGLLNHENTIEGLWIGFILAEMGVVAVAGVVLALFVDWKKEINKIGLNKLRKNLNKT